MVVYLILLAYGCVSNFMIYSPCVDINSLSPYICDGCCSKYYPKKFLRETGIDKSDFAVYK